MTETVIYHNPRCSKSRQTLALLTERGVAPSVIEYLKTPPTEAEIRALLDALGCEPRDLMRTKESVYRDLGLKDETDPDALIRAMAKNPILIERPIVTRGGKAAIGRPPESVLKIL
ncbi:MAG: arsenate reductase (glutaredoxin) [Alphaproteobacteria bacterium]|nr:arsenate reductase (glutaredoxin) [Alphaproteobacteria bacterium]